MHIIRGRTRISRFLNSFQARSMGEAPPPHATAKRRCRVQRMLKRAFPPPSLPAPRKEKGKVLLVPTTHLLRGILPAAASWLQLSRCLRRRAFDWEGDYNRAPLYLLSPRVFSWPIDLYASALLASSSEIESIDIMCSPSKFSSRKFSRIESFRFFLD